MSERSVQEQTVVFEDPFRNYVVDQYGCLRVAEQLDQLGVEVHKECLL